MSYDFRTILLAPPLFSSLNILADAAGAELKHADGRVLAIGCTSDAREGLALNRAYMAIESAETRQAILDVVLAIAATSEHP